MKHVVNGQCALSAVVLNIKCELELGDYYIFLHLDYSNFRLLPFKKF